MGKITLIALLVIGMAAQAEAKPKKIGASTSKKPVWVEKLPSSVQGLIYFVGIQSDAPSIGAGRDGAVSDVAAQIASEMRLSVSTRWISLKTEQRSERIDDVRVGGKARLVGRRVRDTYWEAFDRMVEE